MVYESRVGDVFVLGASSWRIEDITPDRVLVTPAAGQAGKLPFWHGDTPGRPARAGAGPSGPPAARWPRPRRATATAALRRAGLDELAARNLLRYLADQRAATGYVPDDRTLVVERFRDELGDWRVALHSPYGGPGARAVGAGHRGPAARAVRRDGRAGPAHRRRDPHPGARLRRAAAGRNRADRPGGDQRPGHGRGRRERPVRVAVPGCARSRALLLPRRPAGAAARRCGSSGSDPRSCWRSPAATTGVPDRAGDGPRVPAGRVRRPSADRAARRYRGPPGPCGGSGDGDAEPVRKVAAVPVRRAFMYEGDTPLAERRAQALSLDPALLAELLGTDGCGSCWIPRSSRTPNAICSTCLSPALRDAEGVYDLLRTAGPFYPRRRSPRGVCLMPQVRGWPSWPRRGG